MIWFSWLLQSLWLAPHPKVFSLPNIEEISFSLPTQKRYISGIDKKKSYFIVCFYFTTDKHLKGDHKLSLMLLPRCQNNLLNFF
jgi:hypothetical protein